MRATSIVIDVASRRLDVERERQLRLRQRLASWTAPAPRYQTGVLAKYARLVSSASAGAVTG